MKDKMDGSSNGTGSPSSRFKVDVPTGLDESIPMKSPTPPPPPLRLSPPSVDFNGLNLTHLFLGEGGVK